MHIPTIATPKLYDEYGRVPKPVNQASTSAIWVEITFVDCAILRPFRRGADYLRQMRGSHIASLIGTKHPLAAGQPDVRPRCAIWRWVPDAAA